MALKSPPQSAAAKSWPTLVPMGHLQGKPPIPLRRPITVLGLSWDHLSLDGALAAQFLAAVKRRLESL